MIDSEVPHLVESPLGSPFVEMLGEISEHLHCIAEVFTLGGFDTRQIVRDVSKVRSLQQTQGVSTRTRPVIARDASRADRTRNVTSAPAWARHAPK